MITITNKAAEQIKVLDMPEAHYLRISILGGGCSGFQYNFSLDKKLDDDSLVDNLILVDPMSKMYLEGSNLDYEESLSGSIFKITNPQATTTCGCGESFAI